MGGDLGLPRAVDVGDDGDRGVDAMAPCPGAIRVAGGDDDDVRLDVVGGGPLRGQLPPVAEARQARWVVGEEQQSLATPPPCGQPERPAILDTRIPEPPGIPTRRQRKTPCDPTLRLTA